MKNLLLILLALISQTAFAVLSVDDKTGGKYVVSIQNNSPETITAVGKFYAMTCIGVKDKLGSDYDKCIKQGLTFHFHLDAEIRQRKAFSKRIYDSIFVSVYVDGKRLDSKKNSSLYQSENAGGCGLIGCSKDLTLFLSQKEDFKVIKVTIKPLLQGKGTITITVQKL